MWSALHQLVLNQTIELTWLTSDSIIPGKAHLKEALLQHEEALRVNRMCRELRKKDSLHDVLRHCHDRCLDKYADVDDEDDFTEALEVPPILPGTTYQLTLAYPDFSRHKVADLFRCLGPVAVFSAKHHWSAPRTVQLRKKDDEGYGFSVRGDAPVIVAAVEHNSLADVRETFNSQKIFQCCLFTDRRYERGRLSCWYQWRGCEVEQSRWRGQDDQRRRELSQDTTGHSTGQISGQTQQQQQVCI